VRGKRDLLIFPGLERLNWVSIDQIDLVRRERTMLEVAVDGVRYGVQVQGKAAALPR
jgi:hypothetical protein